MNIAAYVVLLILSAVANGDDEIINKKENSPSLDTHLEPSIKYYGYNNDNYQNVNKHAYHLFNTPYYQQNQENTVMYPSNYQQVPIGNIDYSFDQYYLPNLNDPQSLQSFYDPYYNQQEQKSQQVISSPGTRPIRPPPPIPFYHGSMYPQTTTEPNCLPKLILNNAL
ncbi:uncharacterized protein LOC126900951 [Daktulosphaira vitifoliae]|uniref:uncharacterized protein LOC126900951 n=1 Tax=Daktulosphaira vitifoliae TaxID=58002 RepID=UPI0021A9D6AE|nr:uncharacterized protein LOC126900951 [Daktulosphaira vitifoliae]